jgi:hypothetical protein
MSETGRGNPGTDEELFDVQWETTSKHRHLMTRAQIRAVLGHEVEEIQHRPIIDEWLYPDEPGMDCGRRELAQALGRLESDPGQVAARMITWAEPAADWPEP